MMYAIRNTRSGNLVKDAVSGRTIEFDSPEARRQVRDGV